MLALLLSTLLAFPSHQLTVAPKLKVLVVTGGHGFEAQPFFKMFDDDAGLSYTAVKQEKAAEAYDRDDLFTYDVVVLYDAPTNITDAQKARFRELLQRGIGVVVLHHALLSYQKWPEYEKVAGAKYLLDDERVGTVVSPASTYQGNVDIPARIVGADHPVTAGLHDFTVHDEAYHRMRMQPDITALIATGSEPLLWVRTQGHARIVATSLGHGRGSYEDANFLRLLRQSIRWVAKRDR